MICPECKRSYDDPVRYHRHLLAELIKVEAEFRELVLESKRRFAMVRLLSSKAIQEVSP